MNQSKNEMEDVIKDMNKTKKLEIDPMKKNSCKKFFLTS